MSVGNLEMGSAPAVMILPPLRDPTNADEINHRVANSLQLLSAMVHIEARQIDDPLAREALDMTRRRIGAIASVHRQLYRMQQADTVDLADYLVELGADLQESCGDFAIGRHIMVSAFPVTVTAEDATAIGIIVSELVANACKYAYAPDRPGDVRIALCALPQGGYRLSVEDDGRGVPTLIRGNGMGRRLVEAMARRLGADHDWSDGAPGTRFTLHTGPQ